MGPSPFRSLASRRPDVACGSGSIVRHHAAELRPQVPGINSGGEGDMRHDFGTSSPLLLPSQSTQADSGDDERDGDLRRDPEQVELRLYEPASHDGDSKRA